MTDTFFVKPASPHVKVRRPEKNGAHLVDDGEVVPRDAYYLRRLKDGDLIETTAPKKTPPKDSGKSASKER